MYVWDFLGLKIIDNFLAEKRYMDVKALQMITNIGENMLIFSTSGVEIDGKGGFIGMDSHADVSCAGMDALIISKIVGRTCDVKGFHNSYGSIRNIDYC